MMLESFCFKGFHPAPRKREGYRMKQWLKKRKARGFTLVELLIVIVIIGILAGSLLLVMGSGTDKANATKVVSDMRTLKAAMLMYYADNNTFVVSGDKIKELETYLDREPAAPGLGDYSLETTEAEPVYIVFTKKDENISDGFWKRLKEMKESAGLIISGDENIVRMKVSN